MTYDPNSMTLTGCIVTAVVMFIIITIMGLSGCLDDTYKAVQSDANKTLTRLADVCNCTPAYDKGYLQGLKDGRSLTEARP